MTLKLSQPPPAPRVAALSPTSFLAVFEATPLQRIALVKSGMKARDAKASRASDLSDDDHRLWRSWLGGARLTSPEHA